MTEEQRPLRLTSEESSAIVAGERRKLERQEKPTIEVGERVEVAWARPRRFCDPDTGHVFDPPVTPVFWIVATRVVRRARGGWAVYFDIVDHREVSLMLAYGGGYTTDPTHALDRVEAVLSPTDLNRFSAERRAAAAVRREAGEEQRRRQERAFRGRLRETLAGLDPAAQVALLAKLENEISAATHRKAA